MRDERLEFLLHRCLDGGLTAEEAAELNALILSSPEARRQYWKAARIHSLIREWGAQTWGHEHANVVPFPRARWKPSHWVPALAAAAALVIAFASGWLWPHRAVENRVAENRAVENRGAENEDGEFSGEDAIAWVPGDQVAMLARSADVEWIEPSSGATAGTRLARGWLKIARGIVQVDFLSGARVVIQGPAEFQLVGENEAFCRFGKVRAHVPDGAHGFKVGSPQLALVDLGTEFGMDVPADGNTEVHVFEGSIALTGPVSRQLWKDESVRVEAGALRDVADSPTTYPDEVELTRKADAADLQRHTEWRAAAQRLAAEPALLAFFRADGEAGESRELPNLATQRREGGTDATVVGARWSEGRWPGGRALEFTSPADRVRFHIPGEAAAVTLATWIRVDSLPNKRSGLLFPSMPRERELQWSITRGGELFFAISRKAPPLRVFDTAASGAVVTPMDYGRWMHLASTYDSATGEVVHYKDGRAVGSTHVANPLPVVLEGMDFGNWAARPDQPEWAWDRMAANGYAVRNFTGRLDEFALLSRALTAEEIRRLYETGAPQ